MVLAVADAYGAPAYGAIGRPPAGLVFHTPENVDHTLAQAIAVAKWQATASNTSGGSYHGILGYDASKGAMTSPDAWVMVRSVPWDQAAGGISTVRTNPPWNPDRYPWIRQLLPAAAFSDPNRWLHQISLSGKASWYSTNGYPKGAVIRLAEWVRTLEATYGYDALLMLHRHFQTDRSDPGPLTLPDLILVEYNRLYAAPVPALTDAERIVVKDRAFDGAGTAVRSLERGLQAAGTLNAFNAERVEGIRIQLRKGRAA